MASSLRSQRLTCSVGLLLCLPFLITELAAASNNITLSATPSPAKAQHKITLTATVTAGANPASAGSVSFLDGALSLGSIQVVGTHPAAGHQPGTAVLTLMLAPGAHSLTAVYGGTTQSPGIATSTPVALNVTGQTVSKTALVATPDAQNPNNYDFTATVTGGGFSAPTNTADFADITDNLDLGTATLDPLTVVHSFLGGHKKLTSNKPAQSVVADFNGDGFPDIATANASFGDTSTMSVFLGKGNGQFLPPVDYTTNTFTSGIVSGDFNQDGIPDIAAMSQGDSLNDGDVAVFLGNGDGTFRGPVDNLLGTFPVAIAVGDFDGDGILDVATVDYFANAADISLGNGDGTFKKPVPYSVGGGPYYIATADLNHDGFLDLVVANGDAGTMSVLLGKGDGTFHAQKIYTTGPQPEFIAIGDVNMDGKPDILVANYGDPSVGVFLGKGNGTFLPQVSYPVGGPDAGLAIADLDGDGIPDVAVSYYHPSKVGVLHGNGDGTFDAPVEYETHQKQGYELTLADLNGDGTPDIINQDIDSSISVLLNQTSASATISNIAVSGSRSDQKQVVAKYSGDSRYKKSKSKAVQVTGSQPASQAK
jgi:FG-GAP-like repeat/Bacterial Ig-like domain (group 3)